MILNKFLIPVLAFTILLSPGLISAQKIEWTRQYGSPNSTLFRDAAETTDGGFVMIGNWEAPTHITNSYIVKTDSMGNLLWERFMESPNYQFGQSITNTLDGGQIGLEIEYQDGNNMYLHKLDVDGNTIWRKIFFRDCDTPGLFPLERSTDGSFLVSGWCMTYASGSQFNDGFLMKVSSEGEIIWSKELSLDGFKGPAEIIETSDRSIYVIGSHEPNGGPFKIFISKHNSEGDIIWFREYYQWDNQVTSATLMANGDILVGGYIGEFYGLLRVNENGDSLTTYDSDPIGLDQTWFTSLVTVGDVGIVATSEDFIYRYDQTMNLLWYIRFDEMQVHPRSVILSNDGGYVVAGQHNFLNLGSLSKIIVYPVPIINAATEWLDIDDDGFVDGILDGSGSYHTENVPIVSYIWTNNGSMIGTEAILNVSLPRGNNNIKLLITDEIGRIDSTETVISVILGDLPTPVITTVSQWNDIDDDGFAQGILDASSSTHPAGYAIVDYKWRYKGTTIGTQSIINISLPTGTNRVDLVVTDENGLVDSTSIDINVHAQFIQTEGPITSAVSSIGDSLFFASSADDKIYHFGTDGIVRWFLKVGGDIQSTTTIGPNNRIYVGSSDTRLYAFNLNGNFEWDISMGGVVTASPAVTPTDILYVGVDNGRLFSLNGTDGSINWNYLTAGPINSSASVGTDGTIYVGSDGGRLYAINPDGSLKWSFIINEPVRSSPALDLNGNIYFGSDDKNFYSLDSDGNENWRYLTGGAIQSSPVIGGDGTIYFGSADNLVYAISSSGELVWSFDAGSPVNGSPTLLPDGKLSIGTDNGRLLVLSSIGELAWYYQSSSAIIAPPLVTDRGMIYVGSSDGSIYGLVDPDLVSPNLGKYTSGGIWPTFQGNNQRTGFQGDVVEGEQSNLPEDYVLYNAFPNPFNPQTIISYGLPQQSDVTLIIYNLIGQEIMRWDEQNTKPGHYSKVWNGTNKFGVPVGSGVYLYRLVAGDFVETKKMVLLK